MTIAYVLMGFVAGLVIGVVAFRAFIGRPDASAEQAREAEAQKVLTAAGAEAELIRKNAQVQGKELAFKLKSEVEEECRQKKADLVKNEEAVLAREEEVEKQGRDAQRRAEEASRKERTIASREQAAEAMARKAEETLKEAKQRLEKAAGMTAVEARAKLTEQIAEEARNAAAAEIMRIETTCRDEAAERTKKIIATAIQRYAGEYVGERTVSVVPLPSDDMKGRLIGREGRNVRALEAATGIDLIIDDTPEAITISCFNPVRREIARLAIARLVADGRIHPTRIEEVVAKCEQEVDQKCKEAGEQAVFDLGLNRIHPDLVKMLGSLKLRSSYAQNLLLHSVEVGFLAGVMAGELGLSVKQARRAGLLHDIGKAVDHEHEGSHAQVGGAVCKKHGEAPRVCDAIAAHHEEAPQLSVLDHIVDAANRLSGKRPGARRETLESYVKRLQDLEKLVRSHAGVERAYAIQMGKEVRVIVDNASVTDEQAMMLSRELAKRIEAEMSYPGQIRVCVVRETRATEYAK